MKLAIINQEASTGGWRYLYFLIKAIIDIRQDYEITIFISPEAENVEEVKNLRKNNFIVISTELFIKQIKPYVIKNKFRSNFFNKIYNIFRKMVFSIRKRKYLYIYKPSIDKLNTYDCIFYAWPYNIESVKTNKPIFFIPHDFIFTHFFGFHSGHVYTREWWIEQYRQLKTFVDMGGHPIVSTPYIAEEYNKTYHESKYKPKIVYLSSFNDYKELKKDEVSRILSKFGINHDYVLYANNWSLHKNMQEVIGAFYYVKQKYPDIKLIVTGYSTGNIYCKCSSPYYLDHCSKEQDYDVKSLDFLSDNEFSAILQGARLVVNSSLCEAGAGSALDAWNMKVPVAMSNIPAFIQQVEFLHTKAEFFDPRNASSIAEAILHILDNPHQARINAEISYNELKKYTWKDVALQYIMFFESFHTR